MREHLLPSVMEPFPEREREAILHEIQCMRNVIHDGDTESREVSSDDDESCFEVVIDDASGSARFLFLFNSVILVFF